MMHEINAIYQSVQFVEANLKNTITIAEMAESAHYSLFHFCRLFNKITRHTPYDYLTRRRLTRSATDLITTRQKIIEIAYTYQFNSPESYIRAFKRLFNTTPGQFRNNQHNPTGMTAFSKEYLCHICQTNLVPVPVQITPLQLTGIMSPVYSTIQETVSNLQQRLHSLHPNKTIDKPVYGLRIQDTNGLALYYFLGFKSSPGTVKDDFFVHKEFPGGQCALFNHNQNFTTIEYSHQYINQSWRTISTNIATLTLEIFHSNGIYIIQ